MKKFFVMLLALAMLLACAACGGDTTSTNSTAPSEEPSAVESTEVESDNSEESTSKLVLVSKESGEGFPCALLDNGEVFWVKGIQSPAEVASRNGLKDAPMALIEVVDDEIRVIGDEIPDWLEEDEERMVQIVLDAMAEWEVAPEADLGGPTLEVKGPTAIDEEVEPTEENPVFACLVMDNGNVMWEEGVTSPSALSGPDDTAKVQVVGMPNGSWDLKVVGEIPGWFDDSIMASVTEALDEWLNGDSGADTNGEPPANAEEAVGVYTFGTTNSYGNSVQYALQLKADGTAAIYYNGFMGVEKSTADSWTFENGVASVGPAAAEDGSSPAGAVFDLADDHSTEWVLNGDGSCVPKDWNGSVSAVAAGVFPDEVYDLG